MTLIQKRKEVALLLDRLKKGQENHSIFVKDTLHNGWWTVISDLAILLNMHVSPDSHEKFTPHVNDEIIINKDYVADIMVEAEAWLAIINWE